MQHSFWHQRWQTNQIGFHLAEVNPHLVNHVTQLLSPKCNAQERPRIFLPLCGKTMDIPWLITQGFDVVGVELSAIAVDALFEQMKLVPTLTKSPIFTIYSSAHITIFQGDFFALTPSLLGQVDAIYDRAALVALPEAMRRDYAEHLITISNCARQLLICFEYDQSKVPGPPFCVNKQEIHQLYAMRYHIETLACFPVNGGLKGQCEANELVWKLTPMSDT